MIRKIEFKIDYLVLLIVMIPTFYVAGMDLRMSQTVFLQMSVMFMLGVFHTNKYIGYFLIWCLFQFVFMDLPVNKDTISNLFFGVFLYQMVVLFSRTEHLKRYMWALFAVLALSVLWIPLQMFNVDPIWSMIDFNNQSIMSEYPGWFSLPAFLGNYASVLLPITLFLNWPLFVVCAIALWFAKSTFSIVAAYLSVLFYFWFKKRRIFFVLLILLGAGVGAYTMNDLPGGQFGRRLTVWQLTLSQAFRTQFFGHGIGSYGGEYTIVESTPSHNVTFIKNPIDFRKFAHDEAAKKGKGELTEYVKSLEYVNPKEISLKFQKSGMDLMIWQQVHSEPIQLFFDTGYVGILIIGLFIFDLFKRFWKYGRQNMETVALMASFIAILAVCLGHFPFHVARLAGPFIIIIAFLDARLMESIRKKDLEI